jgi:iron(III) transport system substrate-binding protein
VKRREMLVSLAASLAALPVALAPRGARAAAYPAAGVATSTLTLYSTTDTVVFEPVIADFQAQHPGVAVRYEELDAGDLYERHLAERRAQLPGADLLLSSAMDLQVKLVNDGYAAPHRSANARALPGWARWRDEAFGFTFEPAVMVFNRAAMAGRAVPRSRAELLQSLVRERDFWRDRVGTYDIARSSVGYLLASQDARLSSEFGALLEALGTLGLRTGQRTADLLDRVARGELAMAYNLLGSYALTRVDAGAPLEIVHPDDYTLAVTRTAVIPASATQPGAAHRFLEYLLSLRGQRTLAARSRLPAVRPELAAAAGPPGVAEARVGALRPIPLGPGLLVYLDQQKRRRMLATWQDVVGPRAAVAGGR